MSRFLARVLIAALVREQFKPAKDAPTVSFKFWDNYRLPGSSGQVLPIMGVIFLVYAGPSIVSPIIPLDIQNLAVCICEIPKNEGDLGFLPFTKYCQIEEYIKIEEVERGYRPV